MKPKKSPQQNPQSDLLKSELQNMINPEHLLVKLEKVVDWKNWMKHLAKPSVLKKDGSVSVLIDSRTHRDL